MIAYLQVHRFYVRALGLEGHSDPVVVTKNKAVLDLNIAAELRRVDADMSARDAKASLMGGIFRDWHADEFVESQREWLNRAVDFSDAIEPDEQHSAWIDLSKHPDPIATYFALIESIPHSQGGLSATKWLSKLAAKRCDKNLDAAFEPQEFLRPIPIHQVDPITFEQAAKLDFLGYADCGKALSIPLDVLHRQFGNDAIVIWNALRGGQGEEVRASYPDSYVADRMYFQIPIEDIAAVEHSLLRLSERISSQLQGKDLFGSTMKLTLEFEEGSSEAVRNFTKPLHDRRTIYFAARRLFESLEVEQPLSALRIAVPDLRHKVRHQETFDQLAIKEKLSRAETAVRCVRKSYGDSSIQIAGHIQIPRRQLVLKEWRNATGWS